MPLGFKIHFLLGFYCLFTLRVTLDTTILLVLRYIWRQNPHRIKEFCLYKLHFESPTDKIKYSVRQYPPQNGRPLSSILLTAKSRSGKEDSCVDLSNAQLAQKNRSFLSQLGVRQL